MANIRQRIEDYFAGELSADQERQLLRELEEHPAEQRYFDHVAQVLRVAADSSPTRDEADRLMARVEQTLDGGDVAPAPAPAASTVPRWMRWVPAVAALFLVGGIVLVALRGDRGDDQTSYRGAGPSPALSDFEIFAVRKRTTGSYDTPRLAAPSSELSLDDLIQFRYRTNSDARLLYLAVVKLEGKENAISEDFRIYYPRPGGEPLPIARQAQMTAVGRSIRLAHKHRPGLLALTAIFTKRPLKREALEVLLTKARRNGDQRDFSQRTGAVTLLRRTYRVVPSTHKAQQ